MCKFHVHQRRQDDRGLMYLRTSLCDVCTKLKWIIHMFHPHSPHVSHRFLTDHIVGHYRTWSHPFVCGEAGQWIGGMLEKIHMASLLPKHKIPRHQFGMENFMVLMSVHNSRNVLGLMTEILLMICQHDTSRGHWNRRCVLENQRT